MSTCPIPPELRVSSGWRRILHRVVKGILPTVARLHRSNWSRERRAYPQLWWVAVRWFPRWEPKAKASGYYRRARGLQVVQKVCGWLTGHETSRTEWGYGGGTHVERSCRWCDYHFRVPTAEEVVPCSGLERPARALGFE